MYWKKSKLTLPHRRIDMLQDEIEKINPGNYQKQINEKYMIKEIKNEK